MTFSQFLQEHGIFTQKQAIEFKTNTNNIIDQTKIIFHLADYFNNLTSSDFYDLASRLYILWEKQKSIPKNDQVHGIYTLTHCLKKVIQANQREGILELKKYSVRNQKKNPKKYQFQDSGFKNLSMSKTTPRLNNFESKNTTEKENGNIHDKLHFEANNKLITSLLNKERKVEDEMKSCTFKPDIGKIDQQHLGINGNNNNNVFERLKKNPKKENEEINQIKKIENELKNCTFCPSISQSPNRLNQSFGKGNPIKKSENIFERLFHEFNLKKQIKAEYEFLKEKNELQHCTFQPQTGNDIGNIDDPSLINKKSEMLYNEFFEKQRKQIKTKVEHDQNELQLQGCTFKPQILNRDKSEEKPDLHQTTQRLYEWEKEKQKRLEEMKKMQDEQIQHIHEEKLKKYKNEYMTGNDAAYERLYKSSEQKAMKMKKLETKVLKDIGATFTPKTNKSSNKTSYLMRSNENNTKSNENLLRNDNKTLNSYIKHFCDSYKISDTPKSLKQTGVNSSNYIPRSLLAPQSDSKKYNYGFSRQNLDKIGNIELDQMSNNSPQWIRSNISSELSTNQSNNMVQISSRQ